MLFWQADSRGEKGGHVDFYVPKGPGCDRCRSTGSLGSLGIHGVLGSAVWSDEDNARRRLSVIPRAGPVVHCPRLLSNLPSPLARGASRGLRAAGRSRTRRPSPETAATAPPNSTRRSLPRRRVSPGQTGHAQPLNGRSSRRRLTRRRRRGLWTARRTARCDAIDAHGSREP